jgi:parallel beta-helix repeat protein
LRKKKMNKFGALFVGLVLLLLFGGSVSAAVINVCGDGSTIQEAVNVANPGDTINVCPGTYDETVTIDRSVVLQGADRTNTIIDGYILPEGRFRRYYGIVIEANDVTIRGFKIQNNFVGIFSDGHSGITIDDNIIANNIFNGIEFVSASLNTISDNEISTNLKGIYLQTSSDSNEVAYNTIIDNEEGITVTDGSGNIFHHNSFIDNIRQASDDSGFNDWHLGFPDFEGNFWTDYCGIDINDDGIGETLLPSDPLYSSHPFLTRLEYDPFPFIDDEGWENDPEGVIPWPPDDNNNGIRDACEDPDGDSVYGWADQCPFVFGSEPNRGCPYAIENQLSLHIINRNKHPSFCGGDGNCAEIIDTGIVKVFDRADPIFNLYFTSAPKGEYYPDIWESNIGKVSECRADSDDPLENPVDGTCIAGFSEFDSGNLLGIMKYITPETVIDPETGLTKPRAVIYVGNPIGQGAFKKTSPPNARAVKEYIITKVIPRKWDGTNEAIVYQAGDKVTVTGSILEVIHPQYVIWENEQTLYPFIFTSDSDWEVDVCLHVPEGYMVVDGTCTQTFVSDETRDILFTVAEIGSPEPDFEAEFTTKHNGKVKTVKVSIQGKRTEKYLAKMEKLEQKEAETAKEEEKILSKVTDLIEKGIKKLLG